MQGAPSCKVPFMLLITYDPRTPATADWTRADAYHRGGPRSGSASQWCENPVRQSQAARNAGWLTPLHSLSEGSAPCRLLSQSQGHGTHLSLSGPICPPLLPSSLLLSLELSSRSVFSTDLFCWRVSACHTLWWYRIMRVVFQHLPQM